MTSLDLDRAERRSPRPTTSPSASRRSSRSSTRRRSTWSRASRSCARAAAGRPAAARAHHRRADLLGDRDHLGRRRRTSHDALARQRERRRRLFALAAEHGAALGATGTHPWADYREQPIIDTEHYRRVEDGLKYVAWRNNTFSLHVHVGVRDIDRAVRVCDRLRPVLPLLLAISANSPFLDGRDSGLHSARTQSFTKSFPRCGVPDAFGGWAAYREYIEFLLRTNSIVEFTQVWWSVRPHFSFGTVEVRICDAQATAQESDALAALMVACIAQAARDVDEGVPFADPAPRLIEENMWRAIRFGLDGRLIDLDARRGVSGARGDRAARRVDRAGARRARHRPRLPRAQRRPAPAPDDRGRRQPRGGLRGVGRGDQSEPIPRR